MLQPVFTTSFQKDVKRVEKRGYDMEKLKEVIKGEMAAEMGAAH